LTQTPQGTPQLASVLKQQPQPHSWATLRQVRYTAAGGGWSEAEDDDGVEVVARVSKDSLQFKAARGAMEPAPGADG
jgi:hypothetical protein